MLNFHTISKVLQQNTEIQEGIRLLICAGIFLGYQTF
jgi:hypothetical protein